MKKQLLFKTLIDTFYYLLLIGLIAMVLIIPIIAKIKNLPESIITNQVLTNWYLIIISFISYTLFLRGLYYLKNVAKYIILDKKFAEITITNLKKSGNFLIYSGIVFMLTNLSLFIYRVIQGKMKLFLNINSFFPFFLLILGLFLVIQSNTLFIAKEYKEENELTV